MDLATAFSRRLPLEVICVLLGLPDDNREAFSGWAKAATSMRSSFGIFRAFLSMRGVIDYVRGQIEECRRHPREGVISELVRAEEDGDKLSEDELISMVFLLLLPASKPPRISSATASLRSNRTRYRRLIFSPIRTPAWSARSRSWRATTRLSKARSPAMHRGIVNFSGRL
ncbi:hypothetical protein [Methyloceanibacter marginalis]|uniref:hypothetical protein n=1 Tax=Methyloceanibacter marginalis TaxID=1774971 RepID=UPI0013904E3A|nr:hypothetical protein [Methyloceanibacter marginalis]